MTGRALALVGNVRRALLRSSTRCCVRIVRDAAREDVPLGQQIAHLIQPLGSERLAWPESSRWQYELAAMELVTLSRGLPGDRTHQTLADCHQQALETIAADAELIDATCDAPPSAAWRSRLDDHIDAIRTGRTVCETSTPGAPLSVRTTVAAAVALDSPVGQSVLIDGAPLPASGPHELIIESPQRLTGQRLFNGLAGALLVDMGPRPRTVILRGRLMAASAAALAQLEAAFEARVDGLTHTLGDELSQIVLGPVRIEKFIRRQAVEVGRSWHRSYELICTEMAPAAQEV